MSQPAGLETAPVPDAPSGNLVDRLAPQAWRPYLRLARIDRPIGWWLLLLPCWWSAALAASSKQVGFPPISHLLLFFVGAIVMRGAGCAYNDFLDRDLDAKVERTRLRPIPSGQVSPRQAVVFTVLLCLVGLAVLLSFNHFAIVTGLVSMIFVAIYPLMKRVTSWPQAVLGLAFAYGGLMGWAAQYGSLSWPAFAVYGAAIAWTMGYDTIYALQDAKDDAVVGIRSTALLFGTRTRTAVGLLYLIALVALIAALRGANAGLAAHVGLMAFGIHLTWQVRRIDIADKAGALMLFRSNRDAGLILFAGLALDAAIRGQV
ncbi:4-hydroxybenzoate octaprenyltransferase [uncultured Alsobacter sp.]|uniref:4-hydroxybenzoate octaprenyltransferase n=1 Tax=uncultured Alsobacter sp. TaxID=1748258 RepID=UPI0025D959BD|nr:4-hydroxybenzoate octaprenyltransferase [uncultured Alsobacter sp.]